MRTQYARATAVLLLASGLVFALPLSADTSSDATAEALALWFKLSDTGFFDDNPTRIFNRALAASTAPYWGVEFGVRFGGPIDIDKYPDASAPGGVGANLGVSVANVGPWYAKLSGGLHGLLRMGDLPLASEYGAVETEYYQPSFLYYDARANLVLFEVARFSFQLTDATECYKEWFGSSNYIATDLSSLYYNKYSFDLINLPRLVSWLGFDRVTDAMEGALARAGLHLDVLTDASNVPELYNGVLFTGLKPFPVLSTVVLPEYDEIFIDGTGYFNVLDSVVTAELGFSKATTSVYRWSVALDFISYLVGGLDRTQTAKEFSKQQYEAGLKFLGGFTPDEEAHYFTLSAKFIHFDYDGFDEVLGSYSEDAFFKNNRNDIVEYGHIVSKSKRSAVDIDIEANLFAMLVKALTEAFNNNKPTAFSSSLTDNFYLIMNFKLNWFL